MGRMDVMIDDALEKAFRERVAKKFGMKKGSMSLAIEEAIREWMKSEEEAKGAEEAKAKIPLEHAEEAPLPSPEFAKEIIRASGENINKCIQCGNCVASCPSGRITAYNSRRIIRKASMGYKDEVLRSIELWLCTTCYTCVERCPRKIDVVSAILTMRNIAVENGWMLDPHKVVSMNLIKTGHAVPIDQATREKRKELGLSELPPTVHQYEGALLDVQQLLKETGFSDLIEKAQPQKAASA
ncbi:MAG: CoB--CoM heterodisulfide reductase subunit C [Candidatus Bathyarchaeia archaeon]